MLEKRKKRKLGLHNLANELSFHKFDSICGKDCASKKQHQHLRSNQTQNSGIKIDVLQ